MTENGHGHGVYAHTAIALDAMEGVRESAEARG